MTHPKQYLLKKICNYENNGLQSLGQLNGKHIEDISNVMKEFAEETVADFIEKLNAGNTIEIKGRRFALKTPKKSLKQQ